MLKIQEGTKSILNALLTGVEEKQARNGKPYCVLTLTDRDGSIQAKIWQAEAKQFECLKETVIEVMLKASSYNGEVSYEVIEYQPTKIPVSEFVIVPPVEIETMRDAITKMIEGFDNLDLKLIVKEILYPRMSDFCKWSAARSVHHAIYGGLLYHSYRMMLAADALAKVYTDVNRELLIAGAILHDIGKMDEMMTSVLGVAEYTTEGNLLGHLYMGAQAFERLKGKYDDKLLLQLQHMLASHHGKLEYGAIVVPHTMEAELLHYIDTIDATMYQYEAALKDIKPEKFSDKVFGLGNKQVVKF